MYDVIIIGAGVIGSSIARYLSKYRLNIAVLERSSDVCEGTSKANSGICHAGYDAKTGTLKAKLNVRGSKIMEGLSKDLGFGYIRCGSMVLCFDEADRGKLNELYERGLANGVEELKILTGDEAREIEPNLSSEVKYALHAPTGAIVDPFGLTVAMAENAAVNGVSFKLNTEVTAIKKENDIYKITCKKHPDAVHPDHTGEYVEEAPIVINAAGVYGDKIHNMVSGEKIEISPKRGEYMLLDTTAGSFVGRTIFQLPTEKGKGILITPTVHGNLLVGPTAEDIEDKEDTETTSAGIAEIKEKASLSAPAVPFREVITSFSGLRAKLVKRTHVDNLESEDADKDFLIGEVPDSKGFFDAVGIESPGLSAAPAVAEYIEKLICAKLAPALKEDFKEKREPIPNFKCADDNARKKFIENDSLYANVICRCCTVTEGEIVRAIHSPIPATTSDAIKRRTGAGMGRCQSGFCNPKVVEILSRELGIPCEAVCKNDPGSEYLIPEKEAES
ncbi:MAG: NAD(P)/FAD-dependent oxidoreductase [Lachnospiraceae bacterium]|nr:NAD(P)/FAD-dependent oxidoreductase [Lachnospiraceae bacterium]